MSERALPSRLRRWFAAAAGEVSRATSMRLLGSAALVCAILAGAGLRLDGLDWDDGRHFHPDERYLSIVANDIRGPSSLAGYFDVDSSPLSPYNVQSGRSYVYGELPLLGTKLVAALVSRDGYGELYLVGRQLSALLGVGSIVLVFLIGRMLFAAAGVGVARAVATLAAAFYALAVIAIQHAHFFTVESWLVFLTLLTFLAAAKLVGLADAPARLRLALLLGLGAAIGAAVSSKLSGLIVAVPVAIALGSAALRAEGALPVRARRLVGDVLALGLAAYAAFRLTSPYAFASSSWLDPSPNERFRTALEEQEAALSGDFLYPPSYQWLLSDRLVDPAWNLLGWGLGPALGLTAVAGLGVLAVAAGRGLRRTTTRGSTEARALTVALMLLAYVAVSFAYFGSLFAHTLRYLVPIAPFLCLAAAAGVLALRRYGVALPIVGGAVLLVTLGWALAFTGVYRQTHTRVAASEWITGSAPPGSVIVNEHWDDGLPANAPPGVYELRELPVFDPDDGMKLQKLYDGLARADLYVLSSPRAWNTIGRLPDRFPLMARFYEELRGGRLGWELAARFESQPELLGVTIDDLAAEETFWVYDHPPVELYRRARALDRAEFERAVCAGRSLPGCP